ncbi:MAG: HAMP domain-containing histidine kinase [Uliginosibacterium sp.]|nr:HAMP domain-containing histidine kinase [Uliginosibacterium sp.]
MATAHVQYGRLRAAILILALALVLTTGASVLAVRLVALLVGLAALAYLARLCLSGRAEARDLAESESREADGGGCAVLASAGHDLRQPVQAISLFAASLAAYPLPESSRKLVAGIEAGVQSLSGMLEAVCGIAKLQAGRLDCALQPVALEAFFAHVVEDKLDIAHGVPLHLRHVHTRHQVSADAALLQQALNCLLDLALSECEVEGGILLGCRTRGSERWIELRYTNTRSRQAAHVTEFVPGEAYCNGLPDKGYGLAYVHGLARLMGGRLEAFVWPQRGSLLRLRLQAA